MKVNTILWNLLLTKMTGEIRGIETHKYNLSFSAVNEYILLKGRSIVRRTNQIHNFHRDGMERVFYFYVYREYNAHKRLHVWSPNMVVSDPL
jgi:hypothetical protein